MSEKTKQNAIKGETKRGNLISRKPKKRFSQTKNSPVDQVLHLQRTMGNRAVTRLFQSGAIQTKLNIGKPNDIYEKEADSVADRVMSMRTSEPKGSLVNGHSSLAQRQSTCPECPEKEGIQTKPLAEQITPLIQRQADEEEEVQTNLQRQAEEEEEKEPIQTKLVQRQGTEEEEEPVQGKLLQRQETEEEEEPVQTKLQRQAEEEEETAQAKSAPGNTPGVTPNIESNINSMKGGGQPLSESTRSFFEPRFGTDFSQVRVHTDGKAGKIARSINAKAFTTGKDIVFNSGQYSPGTSSGKQLMAHELTHVVQQSDGHILKNATSTLFRVPLVLNDYRNEPIDAEGNIVRDRRTGGGTPTLVIQQPVANTIFNIDATPQMPTINCRAIIQGVNPNPTSTTNFNWRIRIRENIAGGGCPSAGIGNCTSSYQYTRRGGNLTPQITIIQGGDTTIEAEANVGGTTLRRSVRVSIIGTNPGSAAVSTACGGAGSDADKIACQESRRRQFNANGNPLLGGGGDVGIMQLCNPAATCFQRWSWTGNIGAGLALIQQKRTWARNYLNTHRDTNGNYPNSLNLNNTAVLQRETMQRYNGGTYWDWDARGNRWVPNPPNNYVNSVLSCR